MTKPGRDTPARKRKHAAAALPGRGRWRGGAREKGCAPRGQSARARLSARGKEGAGYRGPHVTPGLGPLPIQKPELQRNCP